VPTSKTAREPVEIRNYLIDEPLEERYQLAEKERRYVPESNEFVVKASEEISISYERLVITSDAQNSRKSVASSE
jgi:hypothetical protein